MGDKKININNDEVKVQDNNQAFSPLDEESLADVNGGQIMVTSQKPGDMTNGNNPINNEDNLASKYLRRLRTMVDSLESDKEELKQLTKEVVRGNDDSFHKMIAR
jgi:hypothetical protein